MLFNARVPGDVCLRLFQVARLAHKYLCGGLADWALNSAVKFMHAHCTATLAGVAFNPPHPALTATDLADILTTAERFSTEQHAKLSNWLVECLRHGGITVMLVLSACDAATPYAYCRLEAFAYYALISLNNPNLVNPVIHNNDRRLKYLQLWHDLTMAWDGICSHLLALQIPLCHACEHLWKAFIPAAIICDPVRTCSPPDFATRLAAIRGEWTGGSPQFSAPGGTLIEGWPEVYKSNRAHFPTVDYQAPCAACCDAVAQALHVAESDVEKTLWEYLAQLARAQGMRFMQG